VTEVAPIGVSTHTRFVILPDRRNSIEVGIFGAALLAAGLYFELGLFRLLPIGLGAVCVTYTGLSTRGRSSFPRIEIDDRGIHTFSIFGTRSFHWEGISWFEPFEREVGEGGTQQLIGVLYSTPDHASSDSVEAVRHDLVIDCYLPKRAQNLDVTTWIADWLNELRAQALSHASVLRVLRHPKYLKGVFV
jgi:hypothetical protein